MTYSERLYIMESKQKAKDREEQERLKEIAKIERKKEQEKEQKQCEKDLKLACYHDLRDSFDRVFEKCLATFPNFDEKGRIVLQMQLSRFHDVEIRRDYIRTFGKTVEEQDYIEKIYDKTLNEVYKKWEKHFEYKQIEEAQKKAQEEVKKQEEINNSTTFKIFVGVILTGVVIWLLIKFALVIGVALAIIIFLVILGCAMK